MNRNILSSSLFSVLMIFCLALGLYWPALIHEFGFHNDYAFLIHKHSWLTNFPESQHVMNIGRFLGGFLISLESHLINNVSDLTIARIISLLGLCIIADRLFRFLSQRIHINPPWIFVLASLFFFLPGNQLNILWATNFIPGILNLGLSLWAYILWSKSTAANSSILSALRQPQAITASFILLAAFFIYPLTALFPIALISTDILFNSLEEWKKTQSVAVKDCLWIIGVMIIYVILDRGVIQPLVLPALGLSQSMDAIYTADVTLNPLEKIAFLWQIIQTSLGGFFHLFWGETSSHIIAGIAGLLILANIIIEKQPAQSNKLFLQKSFWLIGLFFLSILPLMVAKNYNDISYRIAIVPSAIVIFVLVKLTYDFQEKIKNSSLKLWFLMGIAAAIGLQAVGTEIHVGKTAVNHAKELTAVRKQINSVDLNAVDTIIFIPAPFREGFSMTGERFYYEFGFLMETIDHAAPIIIRELQLQNVNKGIKLFCLEDFNRTETDQHTLVISPAQSAVHKNTK